MEILKCSTKQFFSSFSLHSYPKWFSFFFSGTLERHFNLAIKTKVYLCVICDDCRFLEKFLSRDIFEYSERKHFLIFGLGSLDPYYLYDATKKNLRLIHDIAVLRGGINWRIIERKESFINLKGF